MDIEESKELRKGNYLKANGFASNCKEGDVLMVNAIGLDLDFSNGVTQNYIAVDPIPLDVDILLCVGARLQPWGWVLNDFLIKWDHKTKFWLEVGNGKRIEFKYLHTLQNFFNLVGYELILN